MDASFVASTWNQPIEPPERIPESADVVVIGAGILGVSTAWFLARQGIDVVICEKGLVAGEQSSRNWGWVRVQGRDTREMPMAMHAMRIWRGLAEEIGEDVGYEQGGCIFAARTDKEFEKLSGWLEVSCDVEPPREFLELLVGTCSEYAAALLVADIFADLFREAAPDAHRVHGHRHFTAVAPLDTHPTPVAT